MFALTAELAFTQGITITLHFLAEPLTANLLQNTCLHYSGSSSFTHPKVEVSSRTSQPHEESQCVGIVTTTPGARQEVQEAKEGIRTWCSWGQQCCWEQCCGHAQRTCCCWVEKWLSSTVISITCLGYQTGWGEVEKLCSTNLLNEQELKLFACLLPGLPLGLTLEWGVSWNPEIFKS